MKNSVLLIVIILFLGCQNEINFIDSDNQNNTFTQPKYFGDISTIKINEALETKDNQIVKTLLDRIQRLRIYMGYHQERLRIKSWHDLNPNFALHTSDSITQENSLSSFDGEDRLQVSSFNGRDYFWKTDFWFLFYGIADTVVQTSDKLKGHHGHLPSSVDNFYDNINWYKTNDSLVITIVRTGWGNGPDESIWLNTKTKSGRMYFFSKTGYPALRDNYYWNEDGSGSYYTEDHNGVVTHVADW